MNESALAPPAKTSAKVVQPCLPLLPHPSRLVVETTSRCNLDCVMCVKQTQGAACEDGDLSEILFQALEPAFPQLESLVLNGVGEPLLHPRLESMIAKAHRSMPMHATIGFQSNGVLIDERRAWSLLEAGLDKICISADALNPDLFGDIRSGAQVTSVESALAFVDSARRGLGRTDFKLGIEFVAMRSNLEELPRLVSWAGKRGVDFMLVSQLFPYDKSVVAQAAYDANLDGAVTLREKYDRKARAAGLELSRYHQVFMKFSKSADELALTRLVDEMIAESIASGITLKLDSLINYDHSRAELATRVFADAAKAAAAAGIEIDLPNAVPSGDRECEFVEGGSAFVSWDGNVHPCYFLWHRYACYIDGIEKRVRPKVFGNLASRDILEVWNDPAFASFRRNVAQYQYPYCFKCGFALCDYVQGEDFESDCHLNEEPCAACLWCMGLFKCMT